MSLGLGHFNMSSIFLGSTDTPSPEIYNLRNYYLNSVETCLDQNSKNEYKSGRSFNGCSKRKIYALGGFDECTWLSSVEVFDPRIGIWTVEETTMNHARGHFRAAVDKDSIYVIGGYSNDSYPAMADTVENYKEGKEWKEVYTS